MLHFALINKKIRIFFIAESTTTNSLFPFLSSKIRSQILYANNKDRFKRELGGIQFELQATNSSEMSLDLGKGRAFKF
jgi:hypothetical protein